MSEEGYLEDSLGASALVSLEQEGYAERETDLELVERMCAGDGTAVQQIVSRYEGKLIAYAQRIVCSEDLARDICQEVMVKLITKPPLTLQHGNLGPWLFRVAHNLAIDVWRRRRFEITGEDIGEESLGRSMPFSSLAQDHDIRMLRELIRELPEDYRVVVELRIYAEMPYKEIAQTLNIPQGTALWRYHESIKLLSALWRKHDA